MTILPPAMRLSKSAWLETRKTCIRKQASRWGDHTPSLRCVKNAVSLDNHFHPDAHPNAVIVLADHFLIGVTVNMCAHWARNEGMFVNISL